MPKYYILNVNTDVNLLCVSKLDETCFHASLTVTDSDGSKRQYSAWEVTLEELREIYTAAGAKGISLVKFKAAVCRTQSKQTIRMMQKKDYIKNYQSQRKRPVRLKKIMAERREGLKH